DVFHLSAPVPPQPLPSSLPHSLPVPASPLFLYTTLFRSSVVPSPGTVACRTASSRPPTQASSTLRVCRTLAPWSVELAWVGGLRSEEHTSELQSLRQLVCRLLLEKKNSPRQPSSTSRRRP